MNTKQIWQRRKALAGLGAGLLGLGGLGGCATAPEKPAEAAAPVVGEAADAAALAERDFYADWYDATAIVLPPPPANPAR